MPSRAARWKLLGMIAALYFVQGVPLGLAFQAFPVLLRQAGASLDLVAMIPLVTLPWVLKLFLAPWVENHWIARLGRRKSWLLPLQLVQGGILGGMGCVPFAANNADILLVLLGVSSLSGAVQDIATDGTAAERLQGRDIAHVNALQVACFMLGILVGGTGTMVGIDVVGQTVTMMTLSVAVLLSGIPLLFWREPPPPVLSDVRPASLRRFFCREQALRLLFLGTLATASGSTFQALSKLVLVDAGWSLTEVGTLSGVGNSIAVLVGCAFAAILLNRMAWWNALVIGLVLVAGTSTFWSGIAHAPKDVAAEGIWAVAILGGVGVGIVTTATYTLLMRYSQTGVQPATDLSALRGVGNLGMILVSSLATMVAARIGYPGTLISGGLLALGTVVLVFLYRRTASWVRMAAQE